MVHADRFGELGIRTVLAWLEGMGSSISLTLWAFLGMESAATELRGRRESEAECAPGLHVRHAWRCGHLHPLTAVIQGIVPNADLANSTGPFALAYAQMFNPVVGNVIMALAVLGLLGSLLGWQFTIAQTGKSAADGHMFPALFSKVNRMGAPIVGMIVLAIVQSLLALSTISPTLSEQFGAVVNLAVVTNVIPYIIALSALLVIVRQQESPTGSIGSWWPWWRCFTAPTPSMLRVKMRCSAACWLQQLPSSFGASLRRALQQSS